MNRCRRAGWIGGEQKKLECVDRKKVQRHCACFSNELIVIFLVYFFNETLKNIIRNERILMRLNAIVSILWVWPFTLVILFYFCVRGRVSFLCTRFDGSSPLIYEHEFSTVANDIFLIEPHSATHWSTMGLIDMPVISNGLVAALILWNARNQQYWQTILLVFAFR